MAYRVNNTDIRSIAPNPPLFYAAFSATGAAGGGGTAMNSALSGVGVTLSNYLPLREGVTIKNLNSTAATLLRIYGSIGDTGGNKYFAIGGLDDVFIGCTNPSDIFVKNDTAGVGLTVCVYGR